MRIDGSARPCRIDDGVFRAGDPRLRRTPSGSMQRRGLIGGEQLIGLLDLGHAHRGTLRRGFHDHGQARVARCSCRDRRASAAPCSRGRNAHGLREPLGAQLVHADGRTHHAAAGVRQPEEIQRALQRAVFAARAVQRDEHALELAREQLAERLVARIERGARRHRASASAARQALPDFSEISRSLEVPPNSTATRPNSCASR